MMKSSMRVAKWFVSGLPAQTWLAEIGLFLLRFYTGFSLMRTSGRGKIHIRQMQIDPPFIDMLVALGFPFPVFFALLSAFAEIIGAILFAVGLGTRPMAILLAVNMAVAAFPYYRQPPMLSLNLPQLLFWIFVCFALIGSGRLSVDHWLRKWLGARSQRRTQP